MAGGQTIGTGKIDIYADITSFDQAMATLPKKASSKMGEAVKALEAKAAQAKLDLKDAWNAGKPLQEIRKITAEQESLEKKIEAVTRAAIKQAQAIQATARASTPFISPQQATASAAKVAATGAAMNNIWLDGQMAGQLEKTGAAGTKAGQQIRQAGANGAMGLMILSQTIDDAQYGLSAVVNNMPQVGMAIGQAMGVSTEKAMAFGGAMGIAAVAVNTWIQKADHVQAIFGGSQSEDIKELTDQLGTLRDTALSTFASIINLDRGFNWVSTTSKDTEALEKQMADKAEHAAKAAARAKSNRNAVEGIDAAGSGERGAGFTKAVEAFGGGNALADKLVQGRLANGGAAGLQGEAYDKREKQIREQVDADIVAAKSGDKDAIGRVGASNPKLKGLIASNAPGAKEARDKYKREVDVASTRTANNLGDTVGREVLKNPDMGVGELWHNVMEAMKKAGYSTKEIAEQLPQVAHKINADIEAKVKDLAGKEGIDPASARARLLEEAAQRDKNEAASKPESREAERLAAAMEGSIGKEILKGGQGQEDVEGRVRKAMKDAGMDSTKIDAAASAVATKLREKVEEQVRERAMNTGVKEDVARQDLLAEANERANGDRPQAEVMSTESYVSKLLVGALNQDKDDTGEKQLTELQTANKNLATVIKVLGDPKQSGPATFARGR